jgi:hypothetical protein
MIPCTVPDRGKANLQCIQHSKPKPTLQLHVPQKLNSPTLVGLTAPVHLLCRVDSAQLCFRPVFSSACSASIRPLDINPRPAPFDTYKSSTLNTTYAELRVEADSTLMALGACLGASMLLFILLSLLPLSHSSPVTSDTRRISEDLPSYGERQDGYFSVLGVAGVGGTSLHPRLEIRDLERNADQWNIYLLGLRRLQGVDQGDKLSYYQVAGKYV